MAYYVENTRGNEKTWKKNAKKPWKGRKALEEKTARDTS